MSAFYQRYFLEFAGVESFNGPAQVPINVLDILEWLGLLDNLERRFSAGPPSLTLILRLRFELPYEELHVFETLDRLLLEPEELLRFWC